MFDSTADALLTEVATCHREESRNSRAPPSSDESAAATSLADSWLDEQRTDSTVVLTSPKGRVYRNTPRGVDLFPDLGAAWLAPTPRKYNPRKESQVQTLRPAKASPHDDEPRSENHDSGAPFMKILVATAHTQGANPSDYHFCVEGELVWVQEPCPRGDECGCARGFAGAASHRATTTAMVVNSELTRDDMILAFHTSLGDGGWPVGWAEDVTDDNLEIACELPVGAIIVRDRDEFSVRGALFS
jgi:hypothetical protein